jgi:hypothetical protein
MNKRDKTRISLKFKEIAKEVKEFLSSDENHIYPAYHSDVILVNSFDEVREEILINLLNDQIYAGKFSEEYLEKLLKEKMTAMIHDLREQITSDIRPQALAHKTVEDIFSELDNYTTYVTVYLPVSGIDLQLEEEEIELGNITLQKMTKKKSEEIQSYITSAMMASQHTPEEKQALIQYFGNDLRRILIEKNQPIYAIYRVIAEPIQAEKRAKEECYKVFDLLRYALPIFSTLYPMDFSVPKKYFDNDKVETNKYAQREKQAQAVTSKSVSFGLETEIGTYSNLTSNIIILRDPPGLNWKYSRNEPPRSFKIDAHTIEGLKFAKVFEASEIIQKEEASQTNFERCILRSIHWFANAHTSMQPKYILLSLMSSIEAFLNPPDHTKVTSAIIEGVAALEGTKGYTYRKKRIEKLYDKRSALSHGDLTDIMERDISELRAIAFYLIHQMLQRTDEFTTQEQLFESIKKMREEIEQSITENTTTN